MAKVQFVNSVKYNKQFYPAYTPFEVADKDVESLVKSGAIVIVEPEETTPSEPANKSLDEMKVDELKAYAEAHNIDISKAKNKAETLGIIKAAEAE